MELQDTVRLTKPAAGDMISQDAVYHSACLVALYNRHIENIDKVKNQGQQRIEGIALAEMIAYHAYMKDTNIEVVQLPYLDWQN